ncbi:hypothetical protein LZ480_06385 [Solibacillus sp. MA9]|uniref:Uncharacterized protein n=1 Tax=Solibacillus palustris TaxID=2908203 RepID=A0ABS9UC27_9BACL|nr:hypothetical protein [Solibacillus sp. MA9]MCH7321518.1 hypothetical protein [Solibacillus sp. MA9]
MPLEQEVPNILTIGFITIILIFTLSTIALWIRSKGNSTAYSMVSLHLLLLTTAFYFFMNAITLDSNHPMASEENSLQLGIAAVFWGLSMLSLLVAIFKFSSSSTKSKQS